MALQPANPSASVTAGYESRTIASAESMASQLALDNLLRRELKVGDPRDAWQVAEALFSRYKDDPRAQAITQEARGLPFLATAAAPPAPAMPAATATNTELQQAIRDVERDLEELTTNSLLKSNAPELKGWEQAIRTAITEGTTAARFGLDPRQRDKAFGIRRRLGDYARLARFIGAMTPPLTMAYRKLAQSLDEVAAVLLVMVGEALANVGFNSGQYLLQVPFSELQARRDTAINALRNLIGSAQEAYDPHQWARGLNAYRLLSQHLENSGKGDLRVLLVEAELAGIMDELIRRASHGSAEGLRALGATAQIDLERFRRLIVIGEAIPHSPPLNAFLESLKLFADGFDSAGGRRLLLISRPQILFYGLYIMQADPFVNGNQQGIGTRSQIPPSSSLEGDDLMVSLVAHRGRLAKQFDCVALNYYNGFASFIQVYLDKILFDLDRAIDLYALGGEGHIEAECRASAYGYLIQEIKKSVIYTLKKYDLPENKLHPSPMLSSILDDGFDRVIEGLIKLKEKLNIFAGVNTTNTLVQQELNLQRHDEGRWVDLVRAISPQYVP